MQDASSRYKLVEQALVSPGVDWISRSEKGPFVDTGLEVEFAQKGRLYLSVDTVRELAEAAGIIGEGPSQGELSREAQEYFRGYSDAVKENEIGHLDRLVTRLAAVADNLRNTGGVAVEAIPASTPSNSAPSGEPDDLFEEDESGVFTTDGPIDRQADRVTSGKGPARVSSNPSDESYRL